MPTTLREIVSLVAPADVVVVDDGSTDHTADVARSLGVASLSLPFNLGVGAAVRAGLRFGVARGFERAIVVDADGQHDAGSIAALLVAIDGGADVAVGSRFAVGAPPYEVGRLRRGGMRLLGYVVRRLIHQPLSDVTSGFRAFSSRAMSYFASEYPAEFLADTVEVLLKAHAAGFEIVEVPVAMHARAGGIPSSRNVKLFVNYLRLLTGIASWGWRRSLPSRREGP